MTELTAPDRAAFSENLKTVRARIAEAAASVGRDPADVRIAAVTKTFTRAAFELAVAGGIDAVGENRVVEAAGKYAEGHAGAELRLIGHLQTNKADHAAALFDAVDSVDSLRVAQALERGAAKCDKILSVLVEVNVGRDPAKTGAMPEEIDAICAEVAALPHLRLRGLMTVLPLGCSGAEKMQLFTEIRQKGLDISTRFMDNKTILLSMGMSDDYYEAVQCGSTMVRIGSALFGKRVYPAAVG